MNSSKWPNLHLRIVISKIKVHKLANNPNGLTELQWTKLLLMESQEIPSGMQRHNQEKIRHLMEHLKLQKILKLMRMDLSNSPSFQVL
jgi:hypothetical protein